MASLSIATLNATQETLDLKLRDQTAHTPGISGSLDFSNFDEVREPIIRDLIKLINSIDIPDVPFDNGYLKNNNLTISASSKSLSV